MSDKVIAFSAAEWEAMNGLPLMQRWLYMVLRWHMDWRTCIVGSLRRISLQGLGEELYVEPVRGRHAADCGSPSKKAVISSLGALEKAGLIQPRGSAGSLVFFLPKALRASARLNDEGHMRGTQEGNDDGNGSLQQWQGFPHDEGHDEGHTQNHDEGHTSGKGVNHPSVEASAAASSGAVDKSALLVLPLQPEKVAEWIRLQELDRGCRAKVLSRAAQIAAWLELAVTGEELHEAYSLAKGDRDATQNQSPINLPFLDIFVRRVVAGRRVFRGESAAGQASPVWRSSEAGVMAKAASLGVERKAGESVEALRDRVESADLQAVEACRKPRRLVAVDCAMGVA